MLTCGLWPSSPDAESPLPVPIPLVTFDRLQGRRVHGAGERAGLEPQAVVASETESRLQAHACAAHTTQHRAPCLVAAPLAPQVLHCRELGINAMVVMEQYSELGTLLECSKRL